MRSVSRSLLAVVVTCWAVVGLAPASASPRPAPASHYDHIFVIVEENHGFTDVIGNPAAPNLNALASTYGVATNYFGVSHPSEPNYVALLGGSPFTVNSDDPYYVQRVHAPSLISELDHAHVSWKAYLQGLPHAGYEGICYPANCMASRTRTRCMPPSTSASPTTPLRSTRPTGHGRSRSPCSPVTCAAARCRRSAG